MVREQSVSEYGPTHTSGTHHPLILNLLAITIVFYRKHKLCQYTPPQFHLLHHGTEQHGAATHHTLHTSAPLTICVVLILRGAVRLATHHPTVCHALHIKQTCNVSTA